MEADELSALLRRSYEEAGRNEAACQVHLFGIRYAGELRACGCPLRQIVARSGISMGYLSELSKGVKLARYVRLKEEYDEGTGYRDADPDSAADRPRR